MFNTSRQIGGVLAIAVFDALVANRAHFLPGLRESLVIAAVVAFTAAAANQSIRNREAPVTGPHLA